MNNIIILKSRSIGRTMDIERFLEDHPDAVVIRKGDSEPPPKGANIEYIDPVALKHMILGIKENPYENPYDIFCKVTGTILPRSNTQIITTSNPKNDFWLKSYMEEMFKKGEKK